ncbi:hypothetical protein [Phytohalomonas tamaricis]|uniref:hypothetical protein n=1 Tax=Phytohalomonas tamaricis TaxID=2081032 RepID=UPI00131A3782|nr:hypothetical protein [Phytohalomonas tamaricis]
MPRPCVHNVHQLLGSTIRDARRDRSGRVVGIDQTREHPVIDVVWEGQARAERVTITRDQLQTLVEACHARSDKAQDASNLAVTATTPVNDVARGTRRHRA